MVAKVDPKGYEKRVSISTAEGTKVYFFLPTKPKVFINSA